MRNFILVFYFTVITMYVTAGQSDGKNFLWRVTSDTTTVYLLGSIHVAQMELYPLNNTILDTFKRAKYLVVEADIKNMNDEKMNEVTKSKGSLSDTQTLRDVISDKLYRQTVTRATMYRYPTEKINMMKPWLAGITLNLIQVYRLGYDSQYGIDLFFLNEAGYDKEIIELESPIFQIDLLNNLSVDEQELFLEMMLVPDAKARFQYKSLYKYWKSGNVLKLEKYIHSTFTKKEAYLSIYNKLIVERNRTMSAKIAEFLKTYDVYFIVVGAGHLVGNDGIPALLKAKNFTIKQL